MTPDVLTIKWNKDGLYVGASMRTVEGDLIPVGTKEGISIADIMAQLTRHQLTTLVNAAQAQIDIIDAGTPPKKPWYQFWRKA